MATLAEHVYFIQNIINRGVASDDARYSNRFIAHALKQSRSRLVKIKLDKADFISESNYQRICIPLEESSYHDCACINIEDNCKVLRSTIELPEYMSAKWGSTLQVTYLKGDLIPLSNITANRLSKYSIASKKKVTHTLEGNRLYILNNLKLKYVIVKAIWEDPEKLNELVSTTCTDTNTCKEYLSEEFPIDSELVYPMYQLTLQLLGVSFNLPEDTRNDGKAVENIQAIDPNETIKRA